LARVVRHGRRKSTGSRRRALNWRACDKTGGHFLAFTLRDRFRHYFSQCLVTQHSAEKLPLGPSLPRARTTWCAGGALLNLTSRSEFQSSPFLRPGLVSKRGHCRTIDISFSRMENQRLENDGDLRQRASCDFYRNR
jgi:hypothetical protein